MPDSHIAWCENRGHVNRQNNERVTLSASRFIEYAPLVPLDLFSVFFSFGDAVL